MSGQAIEHLDPRIPIDSVVFAIAPLDSFTRGVIRGQVTAEIRSQAARALRNRSGLLVFVHREVPAGAAPLDTLDTQERYNVSVMAEAIGYFDTEVTVERPPDDAPANTRLIAVELHRRPSAAFSPETTLVRGIVVADGRLLGGVRVGAVFAGRNRGAEPAADLPLPFRTRTDERGEFALPLRVPDMAPGQTGAPTVLFWFRFESPDFPPRTQIGRVTEGRGYSFGAPIDLLEATPSATPLLVASRP